MELKRQFPIASLECQSVVWGIRFAAPRCVIVELPKATDNQ